MGGELKRNLRAYNEIIPRSGALRGDRRPGTHNSSRRESSFTDSHGGRQVRQCGSEHYHSRRPPVLPGRGRPRPPCICFLLTSKASSKNTRGGRGYSRPSAGPTPRTSTMLELRLLRRTPSPFSPKGSRTTRNRPYPVLKCSSKIKIF